MVRIIKTKLTYNLSIPICCKSQSANFKLNINKKSSFERNERNISFLKFKISPYTLFPNENWKNY